MFWGTAKSAHALVDRHFGQGRPLRSKGRMWQHLETCEACRERYRVHSMIELMEADGEQRAMQRLAPVDLRGLHTGKTPWAASWGWGLAISATACAGLWLLVAPQLGNDDRDGFRARGGFALQEEPTLRIFKVDAKQAGPAPLKAEAQVTDTIHSTDGLAFSYANVSAARYAYLMIFAANDAGRIVWFWPAWQSQQDDPWALPLAEGTAETELREAVFHDFSVGKLDIFALFMTTNASVKQVEAVFARQGAEGLANVAGAFLWRKTIEVQP